MLESLVIKVAGLILIVDGTHSIFQLFVELSKLRLKMLIVGGKHSTFIL